MATFAATVLAAAVFTATVIEVFRMGDGGTPSVVPIMTPDGLTWARPNDLPVHWGPDGPPSILDMPSVELPAVPPTDTGDWSEGIILAFPPLGADVDALTGLLEAGTDDWQESATRHGADRLREYRFDDIAIANLLATGDVYEQPDGEEVYVLQTGEDSFDAAIRHEGRWITGWRDKTRHDLDGMAARNEWGGYP